MTWALKMCNEECTYGGYERFCLHVWMGEAVDAISGFLPRLAFLNSFGLISNKLIFYIRGLEFPDLRSHELSPLSTSRLLADRCVQF